MAMKVWERAGIEARWIPYESGGKALAALLGGHGAVYVGNPGEVLGNPELKVAAVAAPRRLDAFPDAPTFAELGVQGLDNETMWRGFALRRGTPPGPRGWYARLIAKVAADPAWRRTWEAGGIDTTYAGPEALGPQVVAERAAFEHYLAKLSAQPEQGGQRLLARLGSSGWGAAAMALALLLGFGAWWALGARGRGLSPGAFAVPLLLLSVAGVLLGASLALPDSAEGAGPAAMPRLWLGLLIPVAAVLLVQALGGSGKTRGLTPIQRRGPLLLLGLVGYVVSLWVLGYFVATLAFLVGCLLLLGERKVAVMAAVAGGWLALAWLVLLRVLDVPLPGSALLTLLGGGGA